MKYSVKLTLIACFVAPFCLMAQQEQSLHFMQNVWQSNFTNPAFVPHKGVVVALPSVGIQLNTPDFTFRELLAGDNERVLTFKKLANNLKSEQNLLEVAAHAQTLGISIPLSTVGTKWTLNLHHGINAVASTTFSKNAAKLFAEGNEQFLGQKVAFDSRLNGSIYQEIGVGAAVKLPALTVGGRVKVLFGNAGVFTKKDKLNIGFDKNTYDLAFDNDFEVQTYNLGAFDSTGLGLLGSPSGFGFDLGATFKLGKLSASASILDLGSHLNWKNKAKSYASSGQYNYTGTRTSDFFAFDSLTAEGITDTLKAALNFQEKDAATFRQSLPTRIFLSGTYQIAEKLRLGALLYFQTESTAAKSQFGVTFDATTTLFDVIELGGTLNFKENRMDNLGAHVAVKLAIVQIFAVSDNIITAFQPYNSNLSNGRIGINFVF